uniref:Cadherin domain-containing protein n=1 Tax=Octopus bimaculoides TaxID=37653 RepID=A0A0L8GY88_OCTBM
MYYKVYVCVCVCACVRVCVCMFVIKVCCCVIWWALRRLGVDEWLVEVVQVMNRGAVCKLKVNHEYSKEFGVQVVVHQGSALSPLLFIIVLQDVTEEFKTGCFWELLYTDDVVLKEDTASELEKKFQKEPSSRAEVFRLYSLMKRIGLQESCVGAMLRTPMLMSHESTCADLTYHVEEERSPGTYVADIAADSKLLDNVKPSDQHLITFSQFKRKVAQLFNITKTGKLYTAQTLDAEDLCTFNKECSRIVKVVVNKGTSVTKVLKIKIVIEDINDHEPEFPIKGVNIEFGEHDRKGSDRSIPNAMDKDVGFQNSLIQYKLKSKNGEPFSLSVSKRADGISSLKIVLKESLDREVKDTYLLQVIAKDGGSPAKQGVLNINISITDLNDNPPVFSKPLYNISIQSTHHKSKPIIVLSVSDADSGENDTMSSKRSGRQGDLKHYEEIPGVSDQNIYKNNDTSTSKDSSEETPVKHV